MRRHLLVPAALLGLTALGLAACGKDTPKTTGAAGGPIAVSASDTACDVAKSEAAAGTVTFKVTNTGSKVTEFYVYAAGDRVMGEKENILPGVPVELKIELPAGAYETACKPGMVGDGIRAKFTVSGSAAPLTGDAKLAAASENYQAYVKTQTDGLLVKTQEFAAAVKAGDVAKSKALYPVARTYYERVEPVAESFGDLDPKIDGREDDVEAGTEWTGFHRLEKDLWTGSIAQDGPIADQLVKDVQELVAKATTEKLSPLQLANGAKELLDEMAASKITGEEDRYSHTDLWDFAANLEGSKAAIAALRPSLEDKAPDLIAKLDSGFKGVETTLAKHRDGDGWKLITTLSKDELKELSDSINAVAEPVSKVAAAIS
ncbi:MAG: peptidase M75 family protein [Catenulispora sp.]|nr:peptidase M75 family protein [Catenulispora sp.]